MSDLQIVLIILGALIIAGVVVYNWVQERKLRENISDDFIVPHKDVLVEEFYIDTEALVEKEFADDVHKSEVISKLNEETQNKKAAAKTSAASPEAVNSEEDKDSDQTKFSQILENKTPALKKEHEEAYSVEKNPIVDREREQPKTSEQEILVEKHILPAEFKPLVTSALPDEVHSQIDLTAFLYASKDINGQAFNQMMHTMLKEINVNVMLHGLDDNNVWHSIDSETNENVSYKQIACSMQLADRRGPVPKSIINKFQFAVETIGLEFNAHVEWQGKGDPSVRAIDLDKFCMDVDQLVSVHLIQGDVPIHGTKFKGLAEANDMQLKHGKFCCFDSARPDIAKFILVNADEQTFTPDSLRQNVVLSATFQMEIPKVTNCEDVFSQMVDVAKKMATSLSAHIVDDNQKPLGNLQIEKIRQQLKVIHATMIARGVMPGSESSMRLFN
ncbi:MAG TPA: cell division protein ZipA C-terminal FtsZ-binding domain-containing protein [Methylophilaceae bacterium]|nr:cell division protein ZipA C-terminal FtsZ-binding domain-containing protein [Methylophilaceae bacterium]